MSDQTPNTPPVDDEEPFIPPHYMLYLAVVGLIMAAITAFTQPQFTVVGWGGLGLTILALVIWVLMAPDQAKAFVTGRNLRVGGTTLLVTVIFLVALAAIYSFVQSQNWRIDLTQQDEYSLTDTSRAAISTLGVDPTKPSIKIFAFYGMAQASQRDRDTLLFDDYVDASAGKISYEFINPDRNPILVEKYGNPSAGQLVVATLDDVGEPDLEDAETITFYAQEDLTNALLQVAASGDFRAYFLNVENGNLLDDDTSGYGLSTIKKSLDRLKWKSEQVSLFDLGSTVELDAPGVDGEVLIIAGGSNPLPDEQLQIITDYLDNGGNLILMSAFSLEGETLATADNFSEYLDEHYGLKVNNDIVMDLTSSMQSPFAPIAYDFDYSHFINASFDSTMSSMLFDTTHSLTINPETPPNVVVTELVRSTANAFARTDFSTLEEGAPSEPAADDTPGPFVLAAAAENTETGSRIVVFGNQSVGIDQYEQLSMLGIENINALFRSIAWAASYDSFVTDIPQVALETKPQDTPIVADDQQIRLINLVTIILLPFGVLGIGLIVWMNSRERNLTR